MFKHFQLSQNSYFLAQPMLNYPIHSQ